MRETLCLPQRLSPGDLFAILVPERDPFSLVRYVLIYAVR